ncbi:MAG TPA: RNA 2',3'-cyclic phosphodiesterase [Pyrinomonadaceae bacterium]|nr:RNA 2',3'-cyclic phosphodiesterase [Pyrinomonadaceae bacterium]
MSTKNETWRVFCAIEIPSRTRQRVLQHITKLRASVPDVRASWSRENSIHLTLKFFGEIPEALVNNLGTAISRAVSGVVAFPILIADSGEFPQRRDPRVLWIGVTDLKAQLSNLHQRLETEFENVGFPRDTRAFHPHLTLARLRNQRGARDIARIHEELSFPPEEITVTELLLIRSELSSKGSKYTTISTHPLRN